MLRNLNMNNAVCKDTKSLRGKIFIFRNRGTLEDTYGEWVIRIPRFCNLCIRSIFFFVVKPQTILFFCSSLHEMRQVNNIKFLIHFEEEIAICIRFQYSYTLFIIIATRDTQFGQELALVMQTTHAQRWQYPDVSTCVCFLPLKMYTCRYYKYPWVWV